MRTFLYNRKGAFSELKMKGDMESNSDSRQISRQIKIVGEAQPYPMFCGGSKSRFGRRCVDENMQRQVSKTSGLKT
jgi:hypothetical protein